MKHLLFLLFFSASITTATTQNPPLAPPTPSFLAIIVPDMDSSLVWYQDIFGFEVMNHREVKERGLRQANLALGTTHLELIELNNALSPTTLLEEKPRGTRLNGFFKFGFTIEKFDHWIEHFDDSGVTFRGTVIEDPVSGKRTVIVLDPDGNRIQLFEQ